MSCKRNEIRCDRADQAQQQHKDAAGRMQPNRQRRGCQEDQEEYAIKQRSPDAMKRGDVGKLFQKADGPKHLADASFGQELALRLKSLEWVPREMLDDGKITSISDQGRQN